MFSIQHDFFYFYFSQWCLLFCLHDGVHHCPQEVVQPVTPDVITPGHALRLSARQDLRDKDGNPRSTGEEWLVREVGAYLRDVYEEVGTHMHMCKVTTQSLEERT